LDPAQFRENKAAFVAYSIAGKIRELLYQEPCYCGCDEAEGHESLLNCFTTKHGELCHACQAEVFCCFEEQKHGSNAAAVREALEKRAFMNLDLEKYVAAHYREYKRHAR
jgi:Protein of unknown function with PCYCGC motif